mgnify:CR=1 FL=1
MAVVMIGSGSSTTIIVIITYVAYVGSCIRAKLDIYDYIIIITVATTTE